MMIRLLRFLVFGFFCLVTVTGCGRKTVPVPPQAVIPQAIADLSFFQDESRVVLSWTYPAKTTMATPLQEIDSFEIQRAVVADEEYCAGCPAPFTFSQEVPFEQAVVDRTTRKAGFTQNILRPGHRYLFKVRTKAGWRSISQDSNVISFVWESPAKAPIWQKLIPGDRSVRLAWQPVEMLVDGRKVDEPLKYQLYRGLSREDLQAIGEPLDLLSAVDSGLKNGRTYFYRLRAVRQQQDSTIYGMASRLMEVRPRDMTAPAPPRNLTVVKTDEGAKLLWQRGLEKDLAGYRIYRRLVSDQSAALIGEAEAGKSTFMDRDLPMGRVELIYSITAIDRSEPANESIPSKEVRYESF